MKISQNGLDSVFYFWMGVIIIISILLMLFAIIVCLNKSLLITLSILGLFITISSFPYLYGAAKDDT